MRSNSAARLREQLAAALEPADGLLDEGQQDEALRAPEHVAHFGAALDRLDQRGARPGVVAEQVVDLAEDDLAPARDPRSPRCVT